METRKPIFMSATDGEVIHIFGDQLTYKITEAQAEGRLAIVEAKFAPGHGPPTHVHHDEDEFLVVMKSVFQVCAGTETKLCEPGSVVLLPKDVPHRFQNVGATEGVIVTLIVPGHFEKFFREVHALPTADQTDMKKIAELAAKYHVEFLTNACIGL